MRHDSVSTMNYVSEESSVVIQRNLKGVVYASHGSHSMPGGSNTAYSLCDLWCISRVPRLEDVLESSEESTG